MTVLKGALPAIFSGSFEASPLVDDLLQLGRDLGVALRARVSMTETEIEADGRVRRSSASRR